MIIVECCKKTWLESRTDFQSCLNDILFHFLNWFLNRIHQLSSKKMPITRNNPISYTLLGIKCPFFLLPSSKKWTFNP